MTTPDNDVFDLQIFSIKVDKQDQSLDVKSSINDANMSAILFIM